MHFQTVVTKRFEEKLKDTLLPEISERIIYLYNKVNATDPIAGKIMIEGLPSLFDLDKEVCKKVVDALEIFTKQNIFLGAYFLNQLNALCKYNILDDMIPYLMDLMQYSGRKASYSLYRIEDTLIATSFEYMHEILVWAHKHEFELQWASGIIIEQAASFFRSFGEKKVIKMILLGIQLFPSRPAVIQLYFEEACQIFSNFSFIKAKSFLTEIAKISSDELASNQIYALSRLTQKEALKIHGLAKQTGISEKRLKQLRLSTLKRKNYLNIFSYPELSESPYFSAIFRRWHTFTTPTRNNIINTLSIKDYRGYFDQRRMRTEENPKMKEVFSDLWDYYGWIYIGKKMSKEVVFEMIETLFATKGEQLSMRPFLLKRKLAKEYSKLKQGVVIREDVLKFLNVTQKYLKNDKLSSILSACKDYLGGKYDRFAKEYSKVSLVAKIWARDPWSDMARSDELYSCAFVGDFNDYSAPLYLYDNSVTFMDIFVSGKRKGRIFLIPVSDENNREILFVDIVEGSDVIMRGTQRFQFLLNAIGEYALDLGLKYVVFNSLTYYNDTPRKFVELLRKNKIGQNYYHIMTKKYNDAILRLLAPSPKPPFLNAFKISRTALVEGIMIDAKDLIKKNGNFSFSL